MSATRLFLFSLLFSFPLQSGAAVSADDLPGDTIWYMHADLDQLRTADSGKGIAAWIDSEVGAELREETGIDLSSEVNSITAFSDASNGTVIVIDGPITEKTQEKLVAMAVLKGDIETRKYDGRTYYLANDERHSSADDDEDDEDDNDNDPFQDLEDSQFFTFAVPNKAIITSSENQLKAMLDNGGRIVGSQSTNGALFVLTADVNFVQAGLRANDLANQHDSGDWESNILRNTEQAAILIAEQDGQIAFEGQLKSKDPTMANSIAGIINGLIALQAFNSELSPELKGLIQNTKVKVDGNLLTINTVIDPDLIVSVLSD